MISSFDERQDAPAEGGRGSYLSTNKEEEQAGGRTPCPCSEDDAHHRSEENPHQSVTTNEHDARDAPSSFDVHTSCLTNRTKREAILLLALVHKRHDVSLNLVGGDARLKAALALLAEVYRADSKDQMTKLEDRVSTLFKHMRAEDEVLLVGDGVSSYDKGKCEKKVLDASKNGQQAVMKRNIAGIYNRGAEHN